MADNNKVLGHLPAYRGAYVSGTTYYKYNIVGHNGSAFICKLDSTTTAPSTLDSDKKTLTANTGWDFLADCSGALFAELLANENSELLAELIRDFAQYEELTPLTLSVGESGKYVSNTGALVSNSSYAISQQVQLSKGNIYLFKPSAALPVGVCLCAQYAQTETDVVIEYTKTYDSDGNTLTATADYDSSKKYTYNYDEDSEGNKTLRNITDASGNVVDYIPEYRTVQAGSYVPLFKNLSTTMPKSGYYVVLANDDYTVVFSALSADIKGGEVKNRSYGIFRSIINNKEDKAVVKKLQQDVSEIKASISKMSEQSLAVGFSRVNGSADPAPSEDDCFGKKSYIHDIGTHLRLGVFKDGVPQRTMAAGRLTLGVDGEAVAIDGTEGDVMLYFDCPTELLKAREEVSGVDTNVLGLSLAKAAWQGHVSKTLDRFAVTPDETVNVKLDGDTRQQAHSVYNTSAIGTYAAKSAMFAETFRSSGAGVPTHYVSGLTSVQQAQNKNADALTNRPYMGFYYEFYEAILTLMYAEVGTLYANAPALFGCGCTATNKVSASTFYDTAITGNAGVKWLDADGNAAYTNLMDQVLVGETKTYCMDGLVGNAHYTCAEMLEPQRVLDAIAAAGLISHIGDSAAIFSYDDSGAMTVTTDGSIDPATGTGMTAGKKYYVVRNVPNCEGMADGVMTAVINAYVLMTVDSANTVTISTSDTTARTKAIFKFSFPIYRGFTLPLCGAFRQMQGAHYLYGKEADGTVIHKFLCASNVDNIPAFTSFATAAYYNTVGTELHCARGLDIEEDRSDLTSSWAKSADYGNSLFDMTAGGGNVSSHEAMYRWLKSCWGVGDNGQPANGYISLNASAAGCDANNGHGSARTAYCYDALSNGYDHFAGAFAIPHVQLA